MKILVMSGSLFACMSLFACVAEPDGSVGVQTAALTSDQCEFFQSDGKVRICHATGSTKNPFVVIRVATAGCIAGHEGHARDFIALPSDPDCKGLGCFPVGAPDDPDHPVACCAGMGYVDGVCAVCDKGSYGDGWTCQACPAGTYQDEVGQTSCDACNEDDGNACTDDACDPIAGPSNVPSVAGSSCGSPTDTVCDHADSCDGRGNCQANFASPTTLCRTAAGECDVAEMCDGVGRCPDDRFAGAGSPCGSSSESACDQPDTCDGGGACMSNHRPPGAEVGSCDAGVGACHVEGRERCVGGGAPTTYCDAQAGAPGAEVCGNDEDDDCDGTIDEGCQCGVARSCAASIASDPAVMFCDDFQDGNADGWTVSRDEDSPFDDEEWSVVQLSGDWMYLEGERSAAWRDNETGCGQYSWAPNLSVTANIYVSAFGSSSSSNRGVALHGLYLNGSNSYYAHLKPGNPWKLVLRKRYNGADNTVGCNGCSTGGGEKSIANLLGTTANVRLEIEKRTSSGKEVLYLRAYLGDALVSDGYDETPGWWSGAAAIGTFNASAYFDDIIVKQLR